MIKTGEPNCTTCPHFNRQDDPSHVGRVAGVCMEGPPSIIAIPMPPKSMGIVHGGQQAFQQNVNIQVAFPPVDANICCHRHPEMQVAIFGDCEQLIDDEPTSSPSQTG